MSAHVAETSMLGAGGEIVLAAATPGSRWPGPRPRLVFFRPTKDDLSAFVDVHLEEHLRCLQQFFDVTLVTGDADYDAVCDQVEPDLALFESGVYVRRRRRYTRTDTHREVPKIGLVNADAYCVTRSVYLADMDEWGVDTHFSISPVMAAHTPDIADRLYAWPNFADRGVFHSYPAGDRVPLLLSGSRRAHYPWRTAIDEALGRAFDVTTQPHYGWFDKTVASGMPIGEAYARQISSALIVPTCGTMAHELVRKHLEIPAAGALLLAERTPVLEMAGFVDGVNCVFADEDDVVDKVRQLLAQPDERERIARAGQVLAHTRHDISVRDQMRQWYELRRNLGPGESIVQDDPFEPMRIVADRPHERPVTYVSPPSADLDRLADARSLARVGRLDEAASAFERLLALHFVPEAALGLARTRIAQGQLDDARRIATAFITEGVRDLGAPGPDPVEWALYLRVLLCAGDRRRAGRLARAYPELSHPELDRMRAVVAVLTARQMPGGSAPRRRSVHGVPELSWAAWIAALEADLVANGEQATAARLVAVPEPAVPRAGRKGSRMQALPREFRLPRLPRLIGAVRRHLARNRS